MGRKRTAAEARKDAAPSSGANNTQVKVKPRVEKEKAPKAILTVTPRSDWYSTELASLPEVKSSSNVSLAAIDNLAQYAQTLLEAENKSYNLANDTKSSSQKFASTIMAAGTLEDKVSALTLLIQESPLHNMKAFENLLGLAAKKSRNQALMAAAAMKDLLGVGNVLPDRKLKPFSKQPGLISALGSGGPWTVGKPLPNGLQRTHLILWAFEDWLKKQFFEFLKVLESWCTDEVEYARSRAITYVWELLKDKPEQEENLLRLLVNKLGDTDRKIASRTSYLLLQLQNSHPAMKRIIIAAVENECLFKPSQSLHAQYYSIITLNQTILGKADEDIAGELLRIYFTLFIQLLKPTQKGAGAIVKTDPFKQQGGGGKPGKAAAKKAKAQGKAQEKVVASESELREKMTAQVLTGVNRAFPFADSKSVNFSEQIDTLFRITHSSNFNTSIQALMLLQKLSSRKHHGVDRFYKTLYESLLDPRLITSSKQILYLNLLYKSLKSDVNIKRVQAFVKRLVQILNLHDVPFVCGVLYLISELGDTFSSIKSMMKEPEIDLGDEDEHFVDAPEEGGNGDVNTNQAETKTPPQTYDPRKRDPEHSNADRSAIWEILPLVAHYHPSVALFAESLLETKAMPPKPNPESHTLIHFLDRFIYRNARTKQAATRGSSIMQPLSGGGAADLLIKAGEGTKAMAPVNAASFWTKDIKDVPVDQVFFHNYFNQTTKGKTAAAKKKAKKADADGSEDDDSGEDEIWKALVDSRPEVEGLDDDDDISMGDLESAYGDSDDGDAEVDADMDGDGGVEIADFPDEEDEETGGAELDGQASDEELDFEDDDALLDDDADLPSDIDISAFDDEEEEAEPKATKAKGGKDKDDKGGRKRRKLKHLPTFASVEDYAQLLADEPDENY
ncbi:CBF-domain-containing protein [Myriangium duriaei CBS 260.36]|uniref:CBF-domain-containing protein n=1 Tax=Myriangium duriaei CBS 260.36 TaxID=1168546 RepID=A0A9P4J463_9PEZI|nr:CBF-domain-containing protein [Myriangium duriaei CBS 260.36]